MRTTAILLISICTLAVGCGPAPVTDAAGPAVQADEGRTLFAVELRIGPRWDPSKPPQEQAYFAEHSANLRSLRATGALVLGARYAEIGLIVLSAPALADARALMDADPAIENGTFRYNLYPFNAFYPWSTEASAGR